ncbi:MAG: trypsin-like peptidase domain-containing protein [bacterium]|nr:trypsin-like peptidase domain-containing protein [bacterium]
MISRLLVLILLMPGLAYAAETVDRTVLKHFESVFTEIAQNVKPTVVSIQAETTGGRFERRSHPGGPGPGPDVPRFSSGSGVIISPDGLILTNNHVVESARRLRVRLSDNTSYLAEIVGTDLYTDLALIKIKPKRPLPTAKLGDSNKVKVGQWAIAVGDPFGIARTFTVGFVSGLGRTGVGIARYENFIQTDAAINRGNSGGPLINIDGEVIGINTAIPSPGSGLGFAIPINMAREVAANLRRQGTFPRGYLGVAIQPVASEMAELLGLSQTSGVLVGNLLPDGPAGSAGIRTGDVIVGLDGKKVLDPTHLQRLIGWTPPGQPVSVDVIRGGKKMRMKVTLAKLPDTEPRPSRPQRTEEEVSPYGMNLENLTPDLASKNQLASSKGILVSGVKTGSRAYRDGIRPGMVLRQLTYKGKGPGRALVRVAIAALEDFEKALENIQKGENALVQVVRGTPRGERTFFLVMRSIRMQ